MRHQNQQGIAKSRNQFHDLFHDIRRRNSFHVMFFNIPTIKSNAVRLPGSGKFEYGNQRTGRHNPTNLVIGTLIPSSFLHRPRRRLVRARAFALRHAKRIARRRNTLQGPNGSHALPILSSFLLPSTSSLLGFRARPFRCKFTTNVCRHFARIQRIEIRQSKVPFHTFFPVPRCFLGSVDDLAIGNFQSLPSNGNEWINPLLRGSDKIDGLSMYRTNQTLI